MTYGISYQGGKSRIAEAIVGALPAADVLVDLFGGGGAVTHCAALSGKWNKVIYNELDPLVYRAFAGAVRGEFEYRWVSHEEFDAIKGSDPYAAACYSFGGDFCTYFANPTNEEWKRLACDMITAPTVPERRSAYRRLIRWLSRNEDHGRLQDLENLERLERMRNLDNLKGVETKNLDYRQVPLPPPQTTVVYLDPPYGGTTGYRTAFDRDAFLDWALETSKTYRVFVSEYDLPAPWFPVMEKQIHTTRCAAKNNNLRTEKLWTTQAT